MSEFRYNLTITGNEFSDISKAVELLEEKKIIPYIVDIDYINNKPINGLMFAEFNTEKFMPYGTVSCWDPAEHEKLLHEVSLKYPGLMIELSGENIDDPNNGVFKKAFQNGLFKEAYQEKQDIDALLESASWHRYGEPEKAGQEADIYMLFESISAQRHNPLYHIASDMAYMEEYIELDDPLSPEELYTLASKLHEAGGSWFGEPLLHEEHLDAIRYMLEYGLNEDHSPEFPALNADDTRKLLLSADNQVFGTLVENVAMDNQVSYSSERNYEEDIEAVIPFIEAAKTSKPSLNEKIAAAEEKASSARQEGGKAPLPAVPEI